MFVISDLAPREVEPPGSRSLLCTWERETNGNDIILLAAASVLEYGSRNATGSIIMLFCTIAFNNLIPERRYPKHWL